MAQLQVAIADGIAAVDDAPPALRAFFDVVDTVPDWVDWDLVEEGGRVARRLGQNAADILLQLSLLGGYRFGGPTDLLVATGGLAGDMTRRRLGETQKWTVAVAQPAQHATRRRGLPADAARAAHARPRQRDLHPAVGRRPVGHADQPERPGGHAGPVQRRAAARVARPGRPDHPDESRAVMHLWKYIGWLMGVDDAWLVDTEKEQHRLNYHVLIAQAGISEAGPRLAQAIVEAQNDLHFDRFARLGRWMSRERLLSMLTTLLGPTQHARARASRCGRRGRWRTSSCSTPALSASSAARRGASGTCSGGATRCAAAGDVPPLRAGSSRDRPRSTSDASAQPGGLDEPLRLVERQPRLRAVRT